jgi:hypothetical protein
MKHNSKAFESPTDRRSDPYAAPTPRRIAVRSAMGDGGRMLPASASAGLGRTASLPIAAVGPCPTCPRHPIRSAPHLHGGHRHGVEKTTEIQPTTDENNEFAT